MNLRHAIFKATNAAITPIMLHIAKVSFQKSVFCRQLMRLADEGRVTSANADLIGDTHLAMLWHSIRELGCSVEIMKEDRLRFSLFGDAHYQPLPRNITALKNLLELNLLGLQYGFLMTETERTPIEKAVIVSEDIISLPDGSKFYLETIDPYVIVETFFMEIHKQPIDSNSSVIDVGAAFGDTCIYYARRGARVLAIEPFNYHDLIKNVALNNLVADRITCISNPVGDGEEHTAYSHVGSFDGNARLDSPMRDNLRKTKSVVSTLKLRDVMLNNGFERADVLKMDCKGCETKLDASDLSCIRQFVEITTTDVRKISSLLRNSGFLTWTTHYNPKDLASFSDLSDYATIYARRTGSTQN